MREGHSVRLAAAIVALLVVGLIVCCGSRYWRAYCLLSALETGRSPVIESRQVVGDIKMREYLPPRPNGPTLIVLHGVHHLGIEEPRLMRFAQALASQGIHVFTPELPGAASYHITPSDIGVIGSSVLEASRRTGSSQACVLGLSFSGGLALLAAADPRYASHIRCVIAIGAHDSMERVARFYATDRELLPDGRELHLPAHDYGQMVMVYAHPEDYFSYDDAEAARIVVAEYLAGDVPQAKSGLSGLNHADNQQLQRWMEGHREDLAKKLIGAIPIRRAEMSAVSPAGRLDSLHARVLLLHGAGDNVIPPSETEFLSSDVPQRDLVNVLISPAVSHVEVAKPKLIDKLRLLRWMAQMFAELDDSY